MSIDTERNNIRMKLRIYGYERGRNIMELSPAILRVGRYLNDLPENTNVKGFKCAVGDIVPKAKEILDKYFTLHDVPYASIDCFKSLLAEYSDPTTESGVDELCGKINSSSESYSPFDLPIKLVRGNSMKGNLIKSLFLIDNEKFLDEQQVTFSGIEIGDNVTLLSVATLVHEIVHSQLESIKGSCTNYHNKEVLSIFMEKLVAYELDSSGELLKISERMRNRHLFDNITLLKTRNSEVSHSHLLVSTAYVTSTLKADSLFGKYVNGDIDTQTNILSGIQNVFDGNCTVEEFLDSTDVNLDNSANAFCFRKRFGM